ncbi:T9SS type B sorting domain-containing protein [Cellulophaga lytica]|uniref:T9SS type B sorting domain-containing protein n=1 Tax=Cellulophaga lytica TaxID=979 RepID=UPI0026E2D0F5|nr:T9SS type B sorting domain-containing protein [Cellulophaga lytica]MDO6853669.1 T9SS type B sorting domain-containing protein [Cellulophaga lytica]
MNKITIVLFLFICNVTLAQITLTHNVGVTPVDTDMFSCETTQSWSRTFTLSDFGISENQKFSINSGQVAIYNSLGGASVQFNIYAIDTNFPTSFSITNIIGSSQIVKLPVVGNVPEVITVNFDKSIIIPDGTKRILVDVRKHYDTSKGEASLAYIAGTEVDNDISWYWGCDNYFYKSTSELDTPVVNANFFINVVGEVIDTNNLGPETRLSHNLCDDVFKTRQYTCGYGGLKYGRTFVLSDFGVSENEEFVIDHGQVAFSSVGVHDVKIQFNIYSIDDNFPDSHSQDDLIGSSQVIDIPYFGSGNGVDPKIFDIAFGTPITVPANVKKILVEVFNIPGASSGYVFIAGGVQNNDVSWLRSDVSGCQPKPILKYIPIQDPNVNYFIKVSGNTRHVTNNFEINTSNICSEFVKEFTLEPFTNIRSVVWNFGDPASGEDNNSIDTSPYHDFSADGIYTVTATVISLNGDTNVIKETINVTEPPKAYGIDNVYACEDEFNTGISSSFNTAQVIQQVLGGQSNMIVTFFDGSGNEYDELPNPFTNIVKDQETIYVRVAHNNNPCCYSETSFDLIVNPVSDLSSVVDLNACSNKITGFGTFDLKQVQNDILSQGNVKSVTFYRQNGNQIQEPLNSVENLIMNEEEITVRALEKSGGCYSEKKIKIIANPLPIAYDLDVLIGCDDNGDGISEYFDTSNIESQVVNNQVDVTVSYFDESGNKLFNQLPNPYTNIRSNEEVIIVRVTNIKSGCYDEVPLVLKTSSKPKLTTPQTVYACNIENGFTSFDLSHIEQEILNGQTGINLSYFNSTGEQLQNLLSTPYKNVVAWSETITVRAENELNSLCYAETSFNLEVNELPITSINSNYFICHLEPSLKVKVENNFDYYSWKLGDDIISDTFEVELVTAGKYVLTIGKSINGVVCENSYDFEFKRSSPPTITEVKYKELSNNNFIEIITAGDGDFEYSLDGVSFQDSNYFTDIIGGIYTVMVRDKNGCGEDSDLITVIDYPKFFTPNNDGFNDYWQIYGIDQFLNAKIFIYDRYGKLLKQVSSKGLGWDGFFKGKKMPSSDYWFKVNLSNGKVFSGHFTLKR